MGTSDLERITRRDVLRGVGAGALGLGGGLSVQGPVGRGPRSVIVLALVGGASPWETFDPKPNAPSRVRGPFGSIATAVPGVRISEHLPEIARRLDRLTLIRSINHSTEPTHDAGLRLLLTGRPDRGAPLLGSVVARDLGSRGGMPPFAILGQPIGRVGGPDRFDRSLGTLGHAFEPFHGQGISPDQILDRARAWTDRALARGLTPGGDPPAGQDPLSNRSALRADFGGSEFSRDCRLAARLVAAGTRLVVINMAGTVFGQPSWDGHGRAPFSTFDDLARDLLPAFDRGFAGLVDDLHERGLLGSTLVVAAGEFGRTPWINESGGRDHWPAVASVLVAGGGAPEGLVLGSSTVDGQPEDRPVPLGDLVASIAVAAGLDPERTSLAGARPIPEILG